MQEILEACILELMPNNISGFRKDDMPKGIFTCETSKDWLWFDQGRDVVKHRDLFSCVRSPASKNPAENFIMLCGNFYSMVVCDYFNLMISSLESPVYLQISSTGALSSSILLAISRDFFASPSDSPSALPFASPSDRAFSVAVFYCRFYGRLYRVV